MTSVVETIARLTARERAVIAAVRGGRHAMDEGADKLRALLDVQRVLASIAAPYAVIGGVAVGIRSGVPRATLDVDLAVHSTADRGAVIAALGAAGFSLRGEFPHSINFRHSSGEAVQLAIDPLFDRMIDRAEAVVIAGASIPVVTTADLIEMKERAAADPARRLSKSLRDRADVALLRGDVPDPDEGW
jgi:hypothetical protein